MTREEYIEKIVKDNQRIKAMISEQNNLLSAMRDHTSADVDEAYQRGVNDAWECAKKIAVDSAFGGISVKKLFKIFGTYSYHIVFENYTPQEAIKKIEEYEKQKDAIKKGDEVALRDEDRKAVIMDKAYGTNDWYVFSDNARIESWSKCAFYRTGRTFLQIEEVLKAMREGD